SVLSCLLDSIITFLFVFFLLFYLSFHHRDLHSFPTRRSSDLAGPRAGAQPDHPARGPAAAVQHLHQGGLARPVGPGDDQPLAAADRKSTRLNSSHVSISYAVFCLKKKTKSKTSH